MSTNTTRLIQISVEVTDGEFALIVFINPCTIHGWRPFSVSSQPAVFITYGVTTAQIDRRRNHFDSASLPRCRSQPPHRANNRISVPRYAIMRIDQYWMNTSGM